MAQLVLLDHLVFLGYPVYLEYLEYLECNINANKFIQGQSDIAVKRAGFRKDARLLGAACNVILEVFNGNILFQAETE